MIDLMWYQNNDLEKREGKKWYVRPVTQQTLGLREMALHMAQHNTPFSAGTIEGLLTDFVDCMREQLLSGNAVKIDNLAIFKMSVQSRSYDEVGGIDPGTGRVGAQARVGSAVKAARLLAVATGDFASKRISRSAEFGWSTEARAMIEARRKELTAAADAAPEERG